VSRLRSPYVTVLLARIGVLPAVVEAEDDGEILVSLAVNAPPGLDRVLDRPVFVECVTPRGIQRVTGRAVWSPELPDQLRILREADDTIQRRDAVRVQAVAPVVLTVLELPPTDDGATPPPPPPLETTSLNVSTTGMLVRDPAALPVGAAVRVELRLDAGEAPLTVTGRIVREVSNDKGICIDDISRTDQDRLSRYITEKQRAELRMSR
jgi:hypothetical protein